MYNVHLSHWEGTTQDRQKLGSYCGVLVVRKVSLVLLLGQDVFHDIEAPPTTTAGLALLLLLTSFATLLACTRTNDTT